MVIQRNWKHSNDNLHHSSDDSNGSNHTISSSNTNSSKSYATAMVTTPQLADGVYSKLSQRFGTVFAGPRMSTESLMRSLELLRINVQSAFNKEIDAVVRNFMEVYFEPAFKNLHDNLGDNAGSEDVLRKMTCALLENSKSQYNIRAQSNRILRTADSSSIRSHLTQHLMSALKRPSMAPQPLENIIPSKKPLLQLQQRYNPTSTTNSPQQSHQQQSRRQIFWNTSNITTDTQFILDVQANQAFGLGVDGRERLASKHPELIRYLPDDHDRTWLVQHKIIPLQNRNSRFLFLVYDEVVKLSESETYRNRNNMNLQILHIFKIPHFIIQKMRTFFVDLNIKSHGLITNSYATQSGVSHLRNALLQGSPLVPTSVSSPNGSTVASCDSVSTSSVKPKSLLSSSHATLTALLTSNNDAQSGSGDGGST